MLSYIELRSSELHSSDTHHFFSSLSPFIEVCGWNKCKSALAWTCLVTYRTLPFLMLSCKHGGSDLAKSLVNLNYFIWFDLQIRLWAHYHLVKSLNNDYYIVTYYNTNKGLFESDTAVKSNSAFLSHFLRCLFMDTRLTTDFYCNRFCPLFFLKIWISLLIYSVSARVCTFP